MKTMRDTEVRLTGELRRKHEAAVLLKEARDLEASRVGHAHLEFDTDEIVFQYPLPANGLQKRYTSPTVNEVVCFAPGYPAWEAMT